MDEEEWRARLVKVVARQVRRYRLKRGLSVQKLADICTEEYGLPIKRSVLANFEGGRRPTLSLMELLILSRILNVPPVLLLFPVGLEDRIEVTPGSTVDTWAALKWFTGEDDRFPADVEALAADFPGDVERQDREPVRLYREHERLIGEWRSEGAKLASILTSRDVELNRLRRENDPGTLDGQLLRFAADAIYRVENEIQDVRQDMRRLGLIPPPLPAEIARAIGEEQTGGDQR